MFKKILLGIFLFSGTGLTQLPADSLEWKKIQISNQPDQQPMAQHHQAMIFIRDTLYLNNANTGRDLLLFPVAGDTDQVYTQAEAWVMAKNGGSWTNFGVTSEFAHDTCKPYTGGNSPIWVYRTFADTSWEALEWRYQGSSGTRLNIYRYNTMNITLTTIDVPPGWRGSSRRMSLPIVYDGKYFLIRMLDRWTDFGTTGNTLWTNDTQITVIDSATNAIIHNNIIWTDSTLENQGGTSETHLINEMVDPFLIKDTLYFFTMSGFHDGVDAVRSPASGPIRLYKFTPQGMTKAFTTNNRLWRNSGDFELVWTSDSTNGITSPIRVEAGPGDTIYYFWNHNFRTAESKVYRFDGVNIDTIPVPIAPTASHKITAFRVNPELRTQFLWLYNDYTKSRGDTTGRLYITNYNLPAIQSFYIPSVGGGSTTGRKDLALWSGIFIYKGRIYISDVHQSTRSFSQYSSNIIQSQNLLHRAANAIWWTGLSFFGGNFITPTTQNYPAGGITVNAAINTQSDSVKLYYSDDGEFSWNYVVTLPALDTVTYEWEHPVTGTYTLQFRDLEETGSFNSQEFYIIADRKITILAPLGTSGSITIGDTIQVVIEVQNISQFSLFYAVNDTINWILIEKDIPIVNPLDTITYDWVVPNIFGAIWLLARDIADTTVYMEPENYYPIGNLKRSYPQICWGSGTYPTTCVEAFWIVDQLCGWGSCTRELITSLIPDKAGQEGNFYTHTQTYLGCPPLDNTPSPGVHIYTAIDTTYYRLGEFYQEVNPMTTGMIYKDRYYFFNPADSMFYSNDLINGIDNMLVGDLKPWSFPPGHQYANTRGWIGDIIGMQLYHVQRSKIQGQYLPINQDFESLNDLDFIPVMLFRASAYGGGQIVRAIPLWDTPILAGYYVQDVAQLYTSLTTTRDYFRGIHPKAEKRKDSNVIN